jgi:hypothetical protein
LWPLGAAPENVAAYYVNTIVEPNKEVGNLRRSFESNARLLLNYRGNDVRPDTDSGDDLFVLKDYAKKITGPKTERIPYIDAKDPVEADLIGYHPYFRDLVLRFSSSAFGGTEIREQITVSQWNWNELEADRRKLVKKKRQLTNILTGGLPADRREMYEEELSRTNRRLRKIQEEKDTYDSFIMAQIADIDKQLLAYAQSEDKPELSTQQERNLHMKRLELWSQLPSLYTPRVIRRMMQTVVSNRPVAYKEVIAPLHGDVNRPEEQIYKTSTWRVLPYQSDYYASQRDSIQGILDQTAKLRFEPDQNLTGPSDDALREVIAQEQKAMQKLFSEATIEETGFGETEETPDDDLWFARENPFKPRKERAVRNPFRRNGYR